MSLEIILLNAIIDNKPPDAPSGSLPSSSVVPSFSGKDATSRFDARLSGGMVAPTPPWVDDATTPHFNRAPDSTKLFCNIHDKVQVSKYKFRESLLILVHEAGLKEEDFTLVGDPLDLRFEMQFAGDNRTASVPAKQFHGSLQLGRGKWKPQNVEDSVGTSHKFYVNPDKNPAQMRREVLAKRVQSIISPLCIDKELFVKKPLDQFIVIAEFWCLSSLQGREVLASSGATRKGSSSRLIRQLLRRPLDIMSLVGGQSS